MNNGGITFKDVLNTIIEIEAKTKASQSKDLVPEVRLYPRLSRLLEQANLTRDVLLDPVAAVVEFLEWRDCNASLRGKRLQGATVVRDLNELFALHSRWAVCFLVKKTAWRLAARMCITRTKVGKNVLEQTSIIISSLRDTRLQSEDIYTREASFVKVETVDSSKNIKIVRTLAGLPVRAQVA